MSHNNRMVTSNFNLHPRDCSNSIMMCRSGTARGVDMYTLYVFLNQTIQITGLTLVAWTESDMGDCCCEQSLCIHRCSCRAPLTCHKETFLLCGIRLTYKEKNPLPLFKALEEKEKLVVIWFFYLFLVLSQRTSCV